MIKGPARFEFYLNKLQLLFDKAILQKNPALWLYKNDARTPLFMLEGLAKMYSSLHNKKKFTKLKVHLKLLEDTLGAIDYYDTVAKNLSVYKKINTTLLNYLQAQSREKIQSLNEILVEKKWLSTTDSRINKIQKKLDKADWFKEEKEVKAINDYYNKTIFEITAFVKKSNFVFTNIEADVHELRRKLRWLSIYPQALRGCIQLSLSKQQPAKPTKYLTKEIVNSSFNKFPEAGNSTILLLLEQNHFYALSWMINELGKIKDNGLQAIAVKEALQQTSELDEPAAYKKAYQLLGTKQILIPQLLSDAEALCKTYFEEQYLENLVLGVKAVN